MASSCNRQRSVYAYCNNCRPKSIAICLYSTWYIFVYFNTSYCPGCEHITRTWFHRITSCTRDYTRESGVLPEVSDQLSIVLPVYIYLEMHCVQLAFHPYPIVISTTIDDEFDTARSTLPVNHMHGPAYRICMYECVHEWEQHDRRGSISHVAPRINKGSYPSLSNQIHAWHIHEITLFSFFPWRIFPWRREESQPNTSCTRECSRAMSCADYPE